MLQIEKEIETKLNIEYSHDYKCLKETMFKGGKAVEREIFYLDTEDLALYHAGHTLRIKGISDNPVLNISDVYEICFKEKTFNSGEFVVNEYPVIVTATTLANHIHELTKLIEMKFKESLPEAWQRIQDTIEANNNIRSLDVVGSLVVERTQLSKSLERYKILEGANIVLDRIKFPDRINFPGCSDKVQLEIESNKTTVPQIIELTRLLVGGNIKFSVATIDKYSSLVNWLGLVKK